MPAVGMGIVWFGYSLASWGYLMMRGYPVKFTDWINPLHPDKFNSWPPAGSIPTNQILPSWTATGTAAEGADPTAPPLGPQKAKTPAPVASGSGPVLEA